jgi:hypothetical protein
MELKPGEKCPLLKKDCIKLDCAWFTSVHGVNPETNEPVEHWKCAMTWLPGLLIENTFHQRHTGASVESFRNEMVKANETAAETFRSVLQIATDQKKNKTIMLKDVTNDDV